MWLRDIQQQWLVANPSYASLVETIHDPFVASIDELQSDWEDALEEVIIGRESIMERVAWHAQYCSLGQAGAQERILSSRSWRVVERENAEGIRQVDTQVGAGYELGTVDFGYFHGAITGQYLSIRIGHATVAHNGLNVIPVENVIADGFYEGPEIRLSHSITVFQVWNGRYVTTVMPVG